MSYLKGTSWTVDFKFEIVNSKFSKNRFYLHLLDLFGITSVMSKNVSTKRLDSRMMKVYIYIYIYLSIYMYEIERNSGVSTQESIKEPRRESI